MLTIKAFSIILFSVLHINQVLGEVRFVTSSNGDTDGISKWKRKEQRQDSELSDSHNINHDTVEHHNIQRREAHLPRIDLLKTPSILFGKLKSHLGFGHKPPGCRENTHHRHEHPPPRDFNHDGHNFDYPEMDYSYDFHHYGSGEFHNHDDRGNRIPHQKFPPDHKFQTLSPKPTSDYNNKKSTLHLSTNFEEKVSSDYIRTTTPQIDIRFGDR